MEVFLYQLAIKSYHFLIYLFSFFNAKARLFVNGREKTFSILQEKLKNNSSPVAWFHCASLGEFEQGRPMIEGFKKEFPHYQVLLTFFSPSGYEVRKNYQFADVICYLPMDSAANARHLIALVCPSVAFFVKYEFWYHYTNELHQKNIPIISFSAIFRKEQPFFKWYGGLMRKTLQKFTYIFVQNQFSADLLKEINIDQVSVSGDTRFDRVYEIRESKKEIPIAKEFKNNELTIVIGSSWNEDIIVIAEALHQFPYPIKLIIASHEISENNLQFIEKQLIDKNIIRFSQQKALMNHHSNQPPITDISQKDVLLIDNVGMLSSLYQYGDIAFVGGGFKQGLHNILEPAVFGMPLFFGNRAYQKFDEAISLSKIGVAFPIANGNELKQKLLQVIESQEIRKNISEKCLAFVKENLGASEQILTYLKNNRFI